MSVFTAMFTQPAVVETWLGNGAKGDVFAAPTTVLCFSDADVTLSGRQTESHTLLYTDLANLAVMTVQSRVLFNGVASHVLHVRPRQGGPLFTMVEHLEVELI